MNDMEADMVKVPPVQPVLLGAVRHVSRVVLVESLNLRPKQVGLRCRLYCLQLAAGHVVGIEHTQPAVLLSVPL